MQKTGNVAIHPEATRKRHLSGGCQQNLSAGSDCPGSSQNAEEQGGGTGVTCEFPHATPADFSAHHYNRGAYKFLAPQMAYQNMDVVFGGGNSILTDDIINHFKENGTRLIQNDRKALLDYDGEGKVWALFGDKALPYSMDRNPTRFLRLQR